MLHNKLWFIFIFITPFLFYNSHDPGVENKTGNTKYFLKSKNLSVPDSGKILFTKYCMSCHQEDGSGVPGMYPPLQKSDWVQGETDRLIQVLLKGQEGEIVVNGVTYGNSMPKQDFLTDKQIATILTYVRHNFGNNSPEINTADVSALRKKLKK